MSITEIEELANQIKGVDSYYADKPLGHLHEFYLAGDIDEASKYTDWFDKIRNATESDLVKIYINSSGGDLYTSMQFQAILRACSATTVAEVEGCCCSGATLIFLACQTQIINPHSVFMFHNYSGYSVGKGGEMADQLTFEREWSENFFHDVYNNFLTKKEITQILNNKDLWLNATEVHKRLKRRMKKLTEGT